MKRPSERATYGWYGPPNARRWHFIDENGRSLCGKWLVLAWSADFVDTAYGYVSGECAACKRKLETSSRWVPEELNELIGEFDALIRGSGTA